MPKNGKKSKTEIYKRNVRTFHITDSNLTLLDEISNVLLSEPNLTKLINFALDKWLKPSLKEYKKAKNPEDQNQIIFKLTKEVKEYANTEETFR